MQEALETNKPAKVIVNFAIEVIAASQPTIGTLIATYRVSKWIYQTYLKAANVYDKTGDVDQSIKEVAKETAKYGIATVRDEMIGSVVDIGWDSVKNATDIKTNELQDKILRAATKDTLDEVLPK